MSLAEIDVRDLLGHPGASREHRVRGTLDELGSELAHVREDEPVEADLLLESVVEGVLASGEISGTLSLRCARCLKEFERPFSVRVSELFVERPAEDEDDYSLEPEGRIAPEQMVRDAVGLELPFSPLCQPDCRGLCEICGGDRNLGECPGHDEVDPRWAELDGLLDRLDTD